MAAASPSEVLLAEIKEYLLTEAGEVTAYTDDFCADDYAGGNIDDAWFGGMNDGSKFLANELLEKFFS